MATVLYPGSFDPIHLGHLDVVEQGVELFGHVTVAVMHNREKTGGLFKVEQRMELVHEAAAEAGIAEHVAVTAHAGLAIDVAREVDAAFIVKGLRTAADFEIEQQMALTNHSVTGVRTVYLPCRADRRLHQQPLRPRDRPVRWGGHPHGAAVRRPTRCASSSTTPNDPTRLP